jgi:hypothetical protein
MSDLVSVGLDMLLSRALHPGQWDSHLRLGLYECCACGSFIKAQSVRVLAESDLEWEVLLPPCCQLQLRMPNPSITQCPRNQLHPSSPSKAVYKEGQGLC